MASFVAGEPRAGDCKAPHAIRERNVRSARLFLSSEPDRWATRSIFRFLNDAPKPAQLRHPNARAARQFSP